LSITAPDGLQGELIMMIRVFGVIALATSAAVSAKPSSSLVSTKTHLPPA
jgi:hypothetical protein